MFQLPERVQPYFVLTSTNYFLLIITESILMDESTTVFVLTDKFRSLASLQMVEFI